MEVRQKIFFNHEGHEATKEDINKSVSYLLSVLSVSIGGNLLNCFYVKLTLFMHLWLDGVDR